MRVALLGPIAWRTPPRHYGPWELVTSLLADGLRRSGHRRHALRHARLGHRAPSSTGSARVPTRRTPAMDGRVWEALHVAHALHALGRLRSHPQPSRLVATGLLGAHRDARGHHDPRLLLPAHPARLPAVEERLRLHLGLRPLPRPRLRRHRLSRRRSRPACRFLRRGGDGLVCFGRIHPDKGTARGGRHRAEGRAAARDLRARPGPALLGGGGRAARRRRRGCATSARSARRSGPTVLGAAACLLHPIAFEEPFGLSVVEAMICGTPVVAYPTRLDARDRRRTA